MENIKQKKLLFIMIFANVILWGYSAWHIVYAWNHDYLTSTQVFKHILKTIFVW